MNNYILRIKLRDSTTFMSDEVDTIIYDPCYPEDTTIGVYLQDGTSRVFNLEDILLFQFYLKDSSLTQSK